MSAQELAQKVVAAVLKDLKGRKGLRQEIEGIEDDLGEDFLLDELTPVVQEVMVQHIFF